MEWFLLPQNFIQNDKLRDLFYEINPDIKILISAFYSSENIRIHPKTTSAFLLINEYTFSRALYRLTKKHITIYHKKSTNTFSNSTLCLSKINITTTLEDLEEVFIYRYVPTKILKRYTKVDGTAVTLVTFSVVNSSDRIDLLKGG